MRYINIKTNYGVETVDEFETLKEAIEMLREYNYGGGTYYISQRCTKDWRKKDV